MKTRKTFFYQVNPKYFKDYNQDGIGDLKGMIQQYDYFDFLGADAIILEDVLSADVDNVEFPSFQTVDPAIGNVNDILKLSSISKKFNKKLLLEINIGTIKKNHGWFKSSATDGVDEYQDVVKFSPNKKNANMHYSYSQDTKKYYLIDSKTKEIPLNWQSGNVLNKFKEVIKFWIDNGIDGFVFKKFEYIGDDNKFTIMDEITLKELRKFYRVIKEINDKIIIVGKSDLIPVDNADLYTDEKTRIFDYFLSTRISHLELKDVFGVDKIRHISSRTIVKKFRNYAASSSNILSLGSSFVGRIVSRWGDDGEYWQESAKSLAILSLLTPSSFGLYSGDEIGAPNIGLTFYDDFQTPDLDERKMQAHKHNISSENFMKAQVLQNPINARSLMPWNEEKNGGFSVAKKTITPVTHNFKEINIKNQFLDENSILLFYKNIIKKFHKSSISKIINTGKYKISSLIPGVIKIHVYNKESELLAFVNITDGNKIMPLLSKPKQSKVVLSSYDKEYDGIPRKLDPYESIVISKHTDEFIKVTQQIKLQKIKIKMEETRKRKIAKQEEEKLKKIEAIKKTEEIKAKKQAKDAELAAKIKKVQEEEKNKLLIAEKKKKESAKEAVEFKKQKESEKATKTRDEDAKKHKEFVKAEKFKRDEEVKIKKELANAEKTRLIELEKAEQARQKEFEEKMKTKQEELKNREYAKQKHLEEKEKARQSAMAENEKRRLEKKKTKEQARLEKEKTRELKLQEKQSRNKEQAKSEDHSEYDDFYKSDFKKEEKSYDNQKATTEHVEAKVEKSSPNDDHHQQPQQNDNSKNNQEEEKGRLTNLWNLRNSRMWKKREKKQKEKERIAQIKMEDKSRTKEIFNAVKQKDNARKKQEESDLIDIRNLQHKTKMQEKEKRRAEKLKRKKEKRKMREANQNNNEDNNSSEDNDSLINNNQNPSQPNANNDFAKEKEKAQLEREVDRSHYDKATKLKEDEVAKTTLIDDSIDLDELFANEEKKKNKK